MNRIKAVVYLLLTGLLTSGCATVSDAEEEHWSYSLAAPNHYKMYVEHLEFEKPGVRHWRMPAGNVGCCWKGPYGPIGSGGRMAPFPKFIGIQWFSFAEQKFYQRLIQLPENLPAEMAEPAQFNTGKGTSERPRNRLVIGLAPGGTIVLWIMNQIGNEIEVARMQANQIEGNVREYETRTKSYREENATYLETHGVPTEGW